ncbi:hypothetical protein TSTA_121330 [Talaromyces stipitatus ATCC 10500]|uniref:Endonuclease/exonuclease/phosphatase domain-containing protein n=1 Tax=Talaromyces stipitatus (strain ATCC 10500 / CBS 375.48 / QM 6759 / NRRL 1006) TaxID=441959 RepID=B8MA61_TALSN|nr:uncharacterized protein TSTA_121330 [Talaromyces stipitatus ATCC 10500]EED18390.1 hypothetical protein TSTA_121330 [Talaromyces stipitatus ATCC 10500]
MNVHHPAWGGPGTKIDEQATELLEIMDRHGIELATEEGLVTWERGQSQSTIDLTFLSTTLFHRLILHERAGLQAALKTLMNLRHEGVPGNKAADRAAKRAALMGARRQIVPGDLLSEGWTILAAAAKRRIRQSTKDAWERRWDKQKAGKPTKKLVTQPSKRTLQYWTFLRKATSSILIQLRTERIGLAHYLWRINRREQPYCAYGLSGQSVRHILMECPLYENERGLMWSRIKGFRRTTDLQALLKEKKAAIAIAQFIIDTRVLDQLCEVDPEAVGTYESAEIVA